MAKPTSLSPDIMAVSAPAPTAATAPRGGKPLKARAVNDRPLQIRVPKPEAKAIKIAAAQAEQSVSEFMLACFHAYMQNGKHANG
jgi:hypothetical protein